MSATLVKRVMALFALVALAGATTPAFAAESALLAVEEVDHQAYWYSRYNLNAMLLMSGFGLRLVPPPEKVKALAAAARFDPAAMPKNPYLLRAVYASGDPHFQQPGNFQDLSTLYWDRRRMEKRFEPAAQALTIVKAVSKNLRTDYHQGGKDRFVGLVQLQEALAMGEFLAAELTDGAGLLAPKPEGGTLEAPKPFDQAAGLWAYASLALALTDPDLPLYRGVPGSAETAVAFRRRADKLFQAMTALTPRTARDRAITIEAYGWYAAATAEPARRREALARVRREAERLLAMPKPALDDLAFAVYGLGEAARVLADAAFSGAAQRLFFEEMERLWDPGAGVYALEPGVRRYVYTPERVAAVLSAIHAIRWFHRPGVGAPWDPAMADQRLRAFFTNAVVGSGLQLAHAITLAVNPDYLQREPRSFFTAPTIPLSIEGDGPYGLCPLYAAEVVFEDGRWKVTDRTFRTAPAMLLSTISTWHHTADPDGFIPLRRLTSEGRGGIQR